MNEKMAFLLVAFILIVIGIFIGGYGATRYQRKQYEQQLGELTRSLGEAERRTARIGEGLERGLEIAGRSADREQRITALIDAIDEAIQELRGGLDPRD